MSKSLKAAISQTHGNPATHKADRVDPSAARFSKKAGKARGGKLDLAERSQAN